MDFVITSHGFDPARVYAVPMGLENKLHEFSKKVKIAQFSYTSEAKAFLKAEFGDDVQYRIWC